MRTNIAKNIDNIKDQINSACKNAGRDPNKITIIAVSKKKSYEKIQINHTTPYFFDKLHFQVNLYI